MMTSQGYGKSSKPFGVAQENATASPGAITLEGAVRCAGGSFMPEGRPVATARLRIGLRIALQAMRCGSIF